MPPSLILRLHPSHLAGSIFLFLLAPSLLIAGPGEVLLRVRSESGRGVRTAADQIAELVAAHPELARLAEAEVSPLLSPGRHAVVTARPGGSDSRALANPLARTVLLRLPEGSDADLEARLLRALPEVELAAPNRTLAIGPVTPARAPNAEARPGAADPRRSEQWYLDRVGVATAWTVTRGSPDILIAVIDTGVSSHPDLAPSLWQNDDPPGNARPGDDATDQDGSGAVEDWERQDDDDNGYVDDAHGYDFVDAPRIGGPGDAIERDPDPADDSGHGTAVAGVVGAAAENGIGIAGLAPDCRLMIVRAGFNPGLGLFSGVLEEDDAAAAIVYAAENGARVINLSFGDTIESPIVSEAVAYARGLGVVLVASGGNQGDDGPHFPSGLPGVIAVGASTFADERAAFSSYGPTLDLVAPGENILTTAFEDDYVALSGTSFSAPLTAAAAGLVLARAPDLPASQVEAALWGTAFDAGSPGFDLATGHGRLDAGRALTVPLTASLAILAPGAGTGVDLGTPIVITAEGLGLESFVVEAGFGRAPAEFETLHAATGVQAVADTVALWDTSALSAGEYTLRLRAVDAYEGTLETRTVVEVDHTPPVITGLEVEALWTEDQRLPFVFFVTDDLARGAIDLLPPGGGDAFRRITGAYRTQEHTLRFPTDLLPGLYGFGAGATNAAGLAAFPVPGVAPISAERAMTHALSSTGRELPAGELAPVARDLNGDGKPDLVLMREISGQTFGQILVVSDSLGVLTEEARLAQQLLPRDTGDSDGDGRMEILASGAGTAVLIESAAANAFPAQTVWQDTRGFAIGFATLAGAPVILGIRSDSLVVWRSTGDAAAWTREAYANFVAPGASIGPTFFVGDADQDGREEVVVGDVAGHLLAYRETGPGLAPAYALSLPAATTPLVAGGDLDQDGWPEVVVDVPVALDATSEALLDRRRHQLFVLGAEAGSGFAITSEVGIAGAESRGNCLRVANLDSDPAPEILLVAAPDLYLFDRQPDESWLPIAYASGFRSTTVAVSDLDRDGRMEVFPGGDRVPELEARDGTIPGPLPPSGLRARIDADGAILLDWNAGADRFRLYRASGAAVDCATAPILAEVTVPSYRDSTAGAIATYRVSGITAGVEGECSHPLTVAREAAPRLLGARPDGPRGVRVEFSAPMDGSASDLGNYRLTGPANETLPISSAISIASERGRLLVLGRDLEPGPHVLEVGAVRSLAGVALAGPDTVAFQVIPSAPLRPLHLVRADPVGTDEVLAVLSAAPDTLAGLGPLELRARRWLHDPQRRGREHHRALAPGCVDPAPARSLPAPLSTRFAGGARRDGGGRCWRRARARGRRRARGLSQSLRRGTRGGRWGDLRGARPRGRDRAPGCARARTVPAPGRRARHRLPRGARPIRIHERGVPVPGRGGERSQDRQAGHPAVECRRGRSAPRRETMPFEEILDQEGAKRMLAALLRADRIPGALLFHGPWGVGKTRLALAFARALLCDNGPAGAEVPCNACPACRKGLKLIHPDLRFLFPLPGGKPEESEAEEAETLRAYAADPYAVIQFDRFVSIPIERLRELKRQAQMRPVEGRRKVFVLREADRMLELQQNALLKVLEEPPPDTHFILTTARPQALLPTIVSRCLRVSLGPLPRAIVVERLIAERGVERSKAELAAGMAEGSLAEAMIFAGEDVGKVRDQALDLLRAAEAGGPALHAAAQALAGGKDRGLVRRLAVALAVWHGDLIQGPGWAPGGGELGQAAGARADGGPARPRPDPGSDRPLDRVPGSPGPEREPVGGGLWVPGRPGTAGAGPRSSAARGPGHDLARRRSSWPRFELARGRRRRVAT